MGRAGGGGAPADPSLSSPIARSANPEPTKAENKSAAVTDDRYATVIPPAIDSTIISPPPVPAAAKTDAAPSDEGQTAAADVADADTQSADTDSAEAGAEPTPAEEVQPLALASLVENASEAEPQGEDATTPIDATAAAETAAPETAITRGQEPQDDAANVGDQSADLDSGFNAVTSDGKPLVEPKPLATPAQQTKIGDASTRAKQAFGNAPPPTAGDRYGGAAPLRARRKHRRRMARLRIRSARSPRLRRP